MRQRSDNTQDIVNASRLGQRRAQLFQTLAIHVGVHVIESWHQRTAAEIDHLGHRGRAGHNRLVVTDRLNISVTHCHCLYH